MAKQWYRLKLAILSLLIRFVSEARFLMCELDEDRAKSLEDTGEWNIPRMVLVERGGKYYGRDFTSGEHVSVEEFTYVGAGVFRGWHMFYAERS